MKQNKFKAYAQRQRRRFFLLIRSLIKNIFYPAAAGFGGFGKRLSRKAFAFSRLSWRAVRKPGILWRWLLLSYWFYLAAVVSVVLMTMAAPSGLDTLLAKRYPPLKTKKMFGLIVQTKENPKIAERRKLIMGLGWSVVCVFNTGLLLLELSRIVRGAAKRAKAIESMADTMVGGRPAESLLLYNQALRMVVDDAHAAALLNKIQTLDTAIRNSLVLNTPHPPFGATFAGSAGPTGTVAAPPDQGRGQTSPGDCIGPAGRYRVEKRLGHGAMGVVYLARDQILVRDVALKKLSPGMMGARVDDKAAVSRFRQEARALARLSHPNIVQVYDFIEHDDQCWIAMEYVRGEDLDNRVRNTGAWSVDESARMGVLLAEAMEYAHQRGVVHRDFKPSNVLLTHDKEPKIMDFGLAKLTHASVATITGSVLGSPAFMSPEQARGEIVDARADIYALGVALYQILTGELPFQGDLKSVLTQKITGQKPSLALLDRQTPKPFKALIDNMLAANPADRPASMKAVSLALRSVSAQAP